MKKLVISVCAAFVMVGSVFFLVHEGVLRLPNGMVRDIIGPALEARSMEQARVLLNRMVRRLSIESRKIDYLTRQVEEGLPELAGEGEGTAAGVLRDFAAGHPACSRVRVIDRGLRIRFSTSENDVAGALVDEQVYTPVFQEQQGGSRVLVDTLIGKLVIYRLVDPYGLLFYFDQEVLDPAFTGAGELQYTGFVVTADRTLLVNFPEVRAADEANMARLVRAMRANRSGALRVKFNGHDKTVYYTAGEGEYADWVVGVTLDTGRVRVSPVGAAVLVIQACVIAALVLFLLAAFRGKEHAPAGARLRETRAGEEEATPAGPVLHGGGHAGRSAQVEPEPVPGGAPSGDVAAGEGAPGVVPLDEVEEVEELQEVGEAEIAEQIEELEPLEEMEEENEEEEPGGGSGDGREQPPPPGGGQASLSGEGTGTGHGAGEEPIEEAGEEPIENDRSDFERYDRNPSGTLPGLDRLVDIGTEWSREEDRYMLSGQEVTIAEAQAHPAGDRGAGPARNDELARLIDLIEESGRPNAPEEFHRFMARLGLSRGALLIESGGSYRPAATLGLSGSTAERLRLDAGESIVRNILVRGKILYVCDDAFMSRIMRAKFDLRDASTVKRLFFAPVIDRRREPPLAAILMICLTTGEAVAEHSRPEEILKEIKRLIRQLPNILQ